MLAVTAIGRKGPESAANEAAGDQLRGTGQSTCSELRAFEDFSEYILTNLDVPVQSDATLGQEVDVDST